ncbi:MAG TPA: hypothetical protein VFU89_03795, partial [Rhabdochlamydiaceae bacterium]|nr:hypothetical protein [Rhabdochlamydiaceae bacterium]
DRAGFAGWFHFYPAHLADIVDPVHLVFLYECITSRGLSCNRPATYPKNEKDDISSDEKKELKLISDVIKKRG